MMDYIKYVLVLMFIVGASITIIKIYKAVKEADKEANLISNIMNDCEVLDLLKAKGYI